jgi:hypothetical protein
MQEQELSKKDRKDIKRQTKHEDQERERRMKKTKKLAAWTLVVIGVGFAGWLGIRVLAPEPVGVDYSRAVPNQGATHVAEGTRVEYQSNPPTSGNHWPVPLRPGIYDTQKPDEAIVHSLEHGRVWVSYKPSVSSTVQKELYDIVSGQFAVILTPRSGNDTDIALAAWDRVDTFDLSQDGSLDAKRVRDFILRYKNKGPEYVPQMDGKTYE